MKRTHTGNRGNDAWRSLSTGIDPKRAITRAILALEAEAEALGPAEPFELLNPDYEAGELHQSILQLRRLKETLQVIT